jgi:hypothetical protein
MYIMRGIESNGIRILKQDLKSLFHSDQFYSDYDQIVDQLVNTPFNQHPFIKVTQDPPCIYWGEKEVIYPRDFKMPFVQEERHEDKQEVPPRPFVPIESVHQSEVADDELTNLYYAEVVSKLKRMCWMWSSKRRDDLLEKIADLSQKALSKKILTQDHISSILRQYGLDEAIEVPDYY